MNINTIIENVKNTPAHILIGSAIMILFECEDCGNCCTKAESIAVNATDCTKIAKELNISRKEFIRDYTYSHSQFRSLTKPKEPCRFHIGDGCAIYESRPLVCRLCPSLSIPFTSTGITHLPYNCSGATKIKNELKEFKLSHENEVNNFMNNTPRDQAILINTMLWIHYARLHRGDKYANNACKAIGIKPGYEDDPSFRDIIKLLLAGALKVDA